MASTETLWRLPTTRTEVSLAADGTAPPDVCLRNLWALSPYLETQLDFCTKDAATLIAAERLEKTQASISHYRAALNALRELPVVHKRKLKRIGLNFKAKFKHPSNVPTSPAEFRKLGLVSGEMMTRVLAYLWNHYSLRESEYDRVPCTSRLVSWCPQISPFHRFLVSNHGHRGCMKETQTPPRNPNSPSHLRTSGKCNDSSVMLPTSRQEPRESRVNGPPSEITSSHKPIEFFQRKTNNLF